VRNLKGMAAAGAVAWLRNLRRYIEGRRVQLAMRVGGVFDLEENDFNNLLHWLRGQELKKVPKAAQHFISVGCAGGWYFDWIEACCGPIAKHTGIEYYSPKPKNLPLGVEWIANTAGDMSSIENDTGDILFSGQNIEHLWPDDVVAFLRESWRVLKPNGLLVMDSPNRIVTEKLVWSHPEHTVELTPQEARELVEANGFEVTALRGMWLCIDPVNGSAFGLDDFRLTGSSSVRQRIAASGRADESFCWWLEARKTERHPNIELSENLSADIFRNAWGERLTRFLTLIGQRQMINGKSWLVCHDDAGVLAYGPYMPLPEGRYTARLAVQLLADLHCGSDHILRLDVIDGAAREIVVVDLSLDQFVVGQPITVEIPFSLEKTTFGLQFRTIVVVPASVGVCAEMGLLAHDKSYLSVEGG